MGLFANLNYARTQVYVIAAVCFLCPGMWNALNSLPAATPKQETVKDQQNAAVYICFAIFGLLGGGINNILGPRILAAIGGTGYSLYAAAQYNIFKNGEGGYGPSFSIFSGAYLGVAAGMLWAAQGQICLTYPTESQKGTFFAIFWIIFNLGGVIGNLLSTSLAWPKGSDGPAIGDETYFCFILLMQCGSLVAMLIQPPGTIVREDQSQVEVRESTTVLVELTELIKLFKNPALLTLLLPCFSSNWFYSYQFGPYQTNFSGRSKNLNALFYWAAQAVAAWVLGHSFLDNTKYGRIQRAWTGLYVLIASTLITFGCGAVFEYFSNIKGWTQKENRIDASSDTATYIGPFLLYACYGAYDAFFQVYTYYLIGAISNTSETLSRYSGFYKGMQSAGQGLSWALTGFIFLGDNALSNTTQFWIMVVPCALSVVFWAVFVARYVKDTTVETSLLPKNEEWD
ncbi:hypothetical protein BCR33DRAFT_714783 [Rhizoclosmatium globosum]|uniref:MFS general substrate transporter n=1 Tax=Rhizoclosmatium globosum TaxID=329046 RepID=A0A1Y2CKZ3_9FUNG|nr:hypothetical protein BCR33DRAFT_714783 [Rhizoclosmatium globosum]|eukprot:ORY47699.1 hypothetical protein BCR33DRAFT_714783 [Rhizoclosmatium globosum]